MRVPGGVTGDAPVGVDDDEEDEDENDIVFAGSARAERRKGEGESKGRTSGRSDEALGAEGVVAIVCKEEEEIVSTDWSLPHG